MSFMRREDFEDTHWWSGDYCRECGDSRGLGRTRPCHPDPDDPIEVATPVTKTHALGLKQAGPLLYRTYTPITQIVDLVTAALHRGDLLRPGDYQGFAIYGVPGMEGIVAIGFDPVGGNP